MLPNLSYLLTASAALAAVLALIWIAQRAARLGGFVAGPAGAGRQLSVQEAIAIDPKRRLHLVRCEGRQVLVMTGGAQDLVVGWLPEPGGES
jgi:flagellar protein FliO/FliZ